MKIGFFGTPQIGAYCLTCLANEFEVCFVVTGEDKPAGRNRTLQSPEVKRVAQEIGIPIFQPVSLKDPEFIKNISSFEVDVFVVVAYGKLIPRELFELPKFKTINLHPSLLPKYRGAAPIEWAIINGETETGITVQRINERLDAGDILLQEKIAIEDNMTAGQLYEIMMQKGAELLIRTLKMMVQNSIVPLKQNDDEATYCGKINRHTSKIIWAKSAKEIRNLIRGMNPKPVAWTTFRGKLVRIWNAAIFDGEISLLPGRISVYEKKRLLTGTGNGVLEITEIQPENKRPMTGSDFINGYRIKEGEGFE
ncbi:MAG: methionyl-tRNA formyltransferase [Spirochaetes bacterium]|nr:methionyl-tRNA formyltransferase [Spirochaetota bacterium]